MGGTKKPTLDSSGPAAAVSDQIGLVNFKLVYRAVIARVCKLNSDKACRQRRRYRQRLAELQDFIAIAYRGEQSSQAMGG
jgi:hypothetical protein